MICSELLGDMYSYTVSYWYFLDCDRFWEGENKTPRRKRRGVEYVLQPTG